MKLPILSGIKVVKALRKVDFEVDHQTGSHFILRETKPPYRRVIVPNKKKKNEITKNKIPTIFRNCRIVSYLII